MAKDPYRYFRIEARELIDGLSRGALELERVGGGAEPVTQILRLAHTLKGAARVVKQPIIADLSHSTETLLEPYRDGRPIDKPHIDELLRFVDRMTTQLAALAAPFEEDAPVAPPMSVPVPAPRPAVVAKPVFVPAPMLESLRVDVEEVDGLLDVLGETQVSISGLRKASLAAEQARQLAKTLVEQLAQGGVVRARATAEVLRSQLARHERELQQQLAQLGAEVTQAREAAGRLRLLPVSSIGTALERAVRDATGALGRKASFTLVGGDVRLDAHVLTGVRDALLHVVRNAVTHGVESPIERRAIGKDESGSIRVEVQRHGTWLVFSCRDDGRGIDVAAVRRVAVERGKLDAQQAARLDETSAATLLLSGGLSTAGQVDELSGRGVGLDTVSSIARSMKGEVFLRSERGKGATLELRVPVSLASVTALVVRVGESQVAVPLDAVRRTVRVADAELAQTGEQRSLVFDGAAIPFSWLARLLDQPEPAPQRTWSAIVVGAADGLAALAVDRLYGTAEVMLKAPPRLAAVDAIVAGSALDEHGNPRLVLDPDALVRAARSQRTQARTIEAARAPLLVIDDSLTTRMLEQAILESAGYEVDVAASAEEGLQRAHARRYGLILCDVEMPGMDGFSFLEMKRADPALRDIPAILVSSRDAEQDKQRGLDAGARAYVVKGEFDQGKLLTTIRKLLGGGA
ncbi:MAG: response regulator [Polyangia bacterium]